MKETFIIITWPEIQDYMDKPGFEENSCLINEEPFLSEYGSSAYFVRESWAIWNKWKKPHNWGKEFVKCKKK
jgi:hypothetical protein